jgi:hypothetical protein
VICKRRHPTATCALDRVKVGRELFASYLRRLAGFSGHSNPRLPKRERGIYESANLIDSDAGSDLDFGRDTNFFLSPLGWAWARALKNPANHLNPRARTRARAHTRLGREFDAGPQKT